MQSLLSLAALSLLASAAAAGGGTPGTGGVVPVLSHGAPELGSTLTVRIDDALPGATVGLALSPGAGSFAIAQGTVHLDPVGLVILGAGVADGTGSAAVSAFLPMLAALAERELHFQAFVLDPAATAGAALSNSIHLRILGSRLYIAVQGPPPGASGLLVRSAVRDEDVFLVEATGTGAPVFRADRAQGAIISGGEVRIFDNFFGGVVHALPAPGAVALARDAAGTGFFAFLAGGELRHVDFATGATLGSLTGLGTGGSFSADASATLGYVTLVPPALRRIDLTTLTDLGATPIGAPGDTAVGPPHASPGGSVAAASSRPLAVGADYTLSHVSYGGAVPAVTTTPLGDYEPSTYELAAPASDLYLRWQLPYCQPFGPAFSMLSTPLAAAGTPVPLLPPSPPLGSACPLFSAGQEAGSGAWIVDRCCQEAPDGDEPGALWRLDLATLTWSPAVSLARAQDRVAVVEDAFGSRIFVPKVADFAPLFPATLYAVDALTLVSNELSYSLVQPDSVGLTFHAEAIP
jgi:hypothetical protein